MNFKIIKIIYSAIAISTFSALYTEEANARTSVPSNCNTNLMNFHLYNKAHPNGQLLNKQANNKNNNAHLYVDGPIKFIIHGYGSGINENAEILKIGTAYLSKTPNINVIYSDFHEIAKLGCYFKFLANIDAVGRCAAEFIKNEIGSTNGKITLDRFHVIGVSCGAHVAASLSKYCRDVGLFTRITGLDPALPGFHFPFTYSSHKLNRKHAKFVDVIHTNVGALGVFSSNAHLDIYANGGVRQKGCKVSGWTAKLSVSYVWLPNSVHITTRGQHPSYIKLRYAGDDSTSSN